jgi:hypothetical protein
MMRSATGPRLVFRIAAAAIGTASGYVFATQQPQTGSVVQERAGVTLIEIPVSVVGRDGKPVVGLTLADFELDFKPLGLEPGRYALRVAVTDPSSQRTAEASSPFEVK